MTVTDPGNVFDRHPRYSYVSPAKEVSGASRLGAIDWRADLPPGTFVRFQVRSAKTAAWEGAKGAGSEFYSPATSAGLRLHGPVQFQAILGNPGGGLPILRAVTLEFE